MTIQTTEPILLPMAVGNVDFLRVLQPNGHYALINVAHIVKATQLGGVLFIVLTEGPPVKAMADFDMLMVAIRKLSRPAR